MSIEAMKLALEALEDAANILTSPMFGDAAAALRTAIEQSEKVEPDGIGWLRKDGGYFTPPAAQRQSLTDEEIMQTWEGVIKYASGEVRLKDFARAIEAAHGITGEKT